MEEITSYQNQKIKRLVLLGSRAKERRKAQSFVIEGIRLFLDTPDAYLDEVYVMVSLYDELTRAVRGRNCGDQNGQNRRTLQEAAGILDRLARHETYLVRDDVFKKAADTSTPQGIMALVREPSWTFADVLGKTTGVPPLILITEDVQDPGNLGTMFRTAEAAGATGVIMTRGTVDLFHPKTVRATMSAIFRVPFCVTDNLQQTLEELQADGVRVFAAYLGGVHDYDACDYRNGTAFLIGNEGNGLRSETAAAADEKILIPMEGEIESLNAAMSAGILMYEAHRQRMRRG